ncbi:MULTISPECIES: PNGase F N-terminal domain-containing protein [Capnocytophaga]|uniref:N-glycanase n=1 Tax=Capnocytophaga canis TaxID=1848903 RepID=A0A0B7I291_9FLAO|nr:MULTISPECIES: PNGase F N-terminal domain-containing protein [Capnocytophaga]ATA72304.1 N-glycanase [Capnocytophaga sp. H4358]CEN44202.1 N-glycanase [Capnocytophaga canis]CEN48320.1 N-glycanase [Capnocytophaga canis]CEN53880.1 N-glycanase [Capnocytophaga canis]
MKQILVALFLFSSIYSFGQNAKTVKVFENALVNFSEKGEAPADVIRLQSGRLLVKKIHIPEYRKGTDVSVEITIRSNGDPWDKSGSCFVFKNEDLINVINVAQGSKQLPNESGTDNNYHGIKAVSSYDLPVEILRFMTPFGVGHFSDEQKYPNMKYGRPVSVPKWEDKVVWQQDVSQLESLLTGTFYIGIWIDTWTDKGYLADVSLTYSGRPRPKKVVTPLVNTIYYVNGQKIPDLFAKTTLKHDITLKKDVKNAELYYITTGHGGHSGGDEFIKIKNSVFFNSKKVIDFIPWRDDCAAFRRFNPSSGVWTRKDTAFAYNENYERVKKAVEERLASSDLSRSNWCPGSAVVPENVSLGTLKKGKHTIEIVIPATANTGDQQNHWLVSSYLVSDK